MTTSLSIPSPPISGFQLGPVTIHFYALCIIAGILVAWALSARRWKARGGRPDQLEGVLVWAIPVGIVGARIYHVLTHLPDYFGPGRDSWTVFYIWQGGIGIYGAIAGGALAAWAACRHYGLRLTSVLDTVAPGIAIAQAMGRLGNYFNQELFGLPTDLPWALEIDPAHRPPGYEAFATFHPTFAYESLWNLAVAGVVLWAGRRFPLGRGKTFWLYVALYLMGRIGTEALRIDPAETILGLRNHQFIAIVMFLVAVGVFSWLAAVKPGVEPSVRLVPPAAGDESATKTVLRQPKATADTGDEESAK